MAGHLRNVSNLFAGGTDTALYRESMVPRGCLTEKARILYDSVYGNMANGMRGASNGDSLKSYYSPSKSEMLGNNRDLTAYNQDENQKETAVEVRPTAQAVVLWIIGRLKKIGKICWRRSKSLIYDS